MKNSLLSKELLLLLIEGAFLCITGFFLHTYYNSLTSLEGIKWDKESIECLSNDCKTFRQKINIYRFGSKIEEVKLSFKVINPNYEIKECSVKQHERTLINFISSPEERNLIGRPITLGDSDLNEKNSCSFEMSYLDSVWNYTLTIDLVNIINDKKPQQKFGVFQIEDSKGTRIDHENLDFHDYLRLYLVQVGVIVIILVSAITIIIFLVGKSIIRKSNGIMDNVITD